MPRAGGAVPFVHHTRAMEMRGKLGVVRNIITVRKEHEVHSAHLLDAFYQMEL